MRTLDSTSLLCVVATVMSCMGAARVSLVRQEDHGHSQVQVSLVSLLLTPVPPLTA